MVKGLQSLVAEAGNYYSEFPEIRFFEHSSIKAITSETITENIFVDIIVSCLEKNKKDMWFEKRVNLWELAEPKDPYEALEKYGHPLQPDITFFMDNALMASDRLPWWGLR
jgi:hypothetical protein